MKILSSIRVLVILIMACGVATTAVALPVGYDNSGRYITDLNRGIEWLRLTDEEIYNPVNPLSVNDVLANVVSKPEYRYATIPELVQLFTDYFGIQSTPTDRYFYYDDNGPPLEYQVFIDDFGATNYYYSFGWAMNEDGWLGQGVVYPPHNGSLATIFTTDYSLADRGYLDAPRSDLSHFIISVQPVPEPATMLLFGTGLVGLVGARFRKKQ